jgi:hypothetical protein
MGAQIMGIIYTRVCAALERRRSDVNMFFCDCTALWPILFFSLSDVVHWVKEVLVLVGLPVSSRMSGLPGRLS